MILCMDSKKIIKNFNEIRHLDEIGIKLDHDDLIELLAYLARSSQWSKYQTGNMELLKMLDEYGDILLLFTNKDINMLYTFIYRYIGIDKEIIKKLEYYRIIFAKHTL